MTGVVALLWQKLGSIAPETARTQLRSTASRVGAAPLNSPATSYTFDGEREGIVSATGALQ